MKKIQILNNQNKILSETSNNVNYENECQEFSIRVVFNGCEQYKIENRALNIYPGNFLIINEGTVFNREIYSEIPVSTFSVLYTSQFLNSFHSSVTALASTLLDDPFTVSKSQKPAFLETIYPLKGDMMYNLYHMKSLFHCDINNDLLMNDYLYHCLINFYRIYDEQIIQKSEKLNVLNNNAREELFRRLNNAKDYMLSNYTQDIKLDDICKHACLSHTHLFRTFKQTFHCSPHHYLTQIRLSQAKQMLKNTHYEVREIVNLVGFDSPSSFIRLFKERFGITPGNYRFPSAA